MEYATDPSHTDRQRRRAQDAAEAAQAQSLMDAMRAEHVRLTDEMYKLEDQMYSLQRDLREVLRCMTALRRRFPQFGPVRDVSGRPQHLHPLPSPSTTTDPHDHRR